MKRKTKIKNQIEIIRSIRGSWNGVNPVTKIIPDKRRKPPKYKGKWED